MLRLIDIIGLTFFSFTKYFLHQLKQEKIRFAFDEKIDCYGKQ